MNKFYKKITWFVLGLIVVAGSVIAAEDKVGIINQQEAIDNSICGKNYQAHMQKEVELRQNKLTEKKDIVKKKYDTLQKDKDILSKKELASKQKELELLQQDLQKMHEKFELELSNKDQEEQQKLLSFFNKAITNVGKDGKYAMILPGNVVFYAGDNLVNVTKNVTKELDKVYKEKNN